MHIFLTILTTILPQDHRLNLGASVSDMHDAAQHSGWIDQELAQSKNEVFFTRAVPVFECRNINIGTDTNN